MSKRENVSELPIQVLTIPHQPYVPWYKHLKKKKNVHITDMKIYCISLNTFSLGFLLNSKSFKLSFFWFFFVSRFILGRMDRMQWSRKQFEILGLRLLVHVLLRAKGRWFESSHLVLTAIINYYYLQPLANNY